MSSKSKKVLVTGVAGFLGSHLAESLVSLGHKVVGIDNMLGGYEDNVPKNIEFHKADCCDFEKIKLIMKGINVVYHCAATAHEGLSVFSPFEITKNNYLASVAIFSAAVNEKVDRIIFCSSMARYGGQQTPFTETLMTNSSGLVFTKTLSGFTEGETISYACKFAFAGGLAVTKYLSYEVGSSCSSLSLDDNIWGNNIKIYPNPSSDTFNINSSQIELNKIEIYSLLGKKLKEYSAITSVYNIEDLTSGLYLVKIYTNKGMFTIKKLIKK